MVSDAPSSVPIDGSVVLASDVVFDKPGAIRKRGAITSPTGSTITPTLVQIGAFQSGTLENTKAIYGLPATAVSVGLKVNSIDTSTGAFTALAAQIAAHSSAIVSGRPFRHFANLVFPQRTTNGAIYDGPIYVGGAISNKANVTGTAGTLTIGSDLITGLAGINPTTQMELGGYVYITDGSTPKNVYLGRVTELTSSTSCKVEPAPTISFTATSVAFQTSWNHNAVAGVGVARSGSVGCSFQNRILLGNVYDWGSGTPAIRPRRVIYTILPNETSSLDATGSTQTTQGYKQLLRTAFEDNNFFEVPSADPITALAPIGEGELIIFTKSECFRLTGTLVTQNASTEPGAPPFDVRKISSTIGCISENSIQQTPRGLIFAAKDGVYAYDGSQFRPLMQGKIQNDYQTHVASVTTIGSAQPSQNHYFLSFSTGSYGYLVNLDTLAWSSPSGGSQCIWDSVQDPTATYTRIWAIRWFNTASPANQVGGQLVRISEMMNVSNPGSTDSDGTTVQGLVVTRYYTEGDSETLKNWRRVQIEYAADGTGSLTIQRRVLAPESLTAPTTLGDCLVGADMRHQITPFWATARGVGVTYNIIFNGQRCEFYGLKHSFSPLRLGRSR
jgi:hypothetical protein